MSEIKQQIPIGYKLTEVGTIPIDWNSEKLQDVSNIARGGSPRPIENYLTNSFDGINWIKIGDVGVNSKYIESTKEKIVQDGVSRSRYVCKGDFLLSNSMSFGRPYILKIDGCIHDGWLVIQKYKENFNTDFLYYFLGSNFVIQQYKAMASGSSVLNLNKEIVGKVNVLRPPLEEQNSIATVLSDMDELIDSLDKLITKKKNIKQGVMHSLLSPKDGWEEKRLGEICELKNGYSFKGSTYDPTGRYSVVTISNVQDGSMDTKEFNKIKNIPIDFQKYQRLKKGDILVSMTGNVGRVCIVTISDTLLNQRVGKIEPQNIERLFLFYLLYDRKFLNKMVLNAQGGAQGNIGKLDILNYIVSLPPTLEEQEHIANILSDMDEEIEQLENKKKKYEAIKQGAMQQLLTGKIRLLNK